MKFDSRAEFEQIESVNTHLKREKSERTKMNSRNSLFMFFNFVELSPDEFVVFDGMNKGELDNVTLLSRVSANKHLQDMQKAVAKVVNEKQYDWKVVRVSLEGDVEFE